MFHEARVWQMPKYVRKTRNYTIQIALRRQPPPFHEYLQWKWTFLFSPHCKLTHNLSRANDKSKSFCLTESPVSKQLQFQFSKSVKFSRLTYRMDLPWQLVRWFESSKLKILKNNQSLVRSLPSAFFCPVLQRKTVAYLTGSVSLIWQNGVVVEWWEAIPTL